jgi:hypothetical protein
MKKEWEKEEEREGAGARFADTASKHVLVVIESCAS